ncbi:DUF5990 family protein [Streptomyces catenulae]|uniref:DUF5990 family protein n=1 Tax=Streptomyces catenulae TaxID=66875 RepID=A0ABV2Z0H2_9ACTN|nr:DUF5990 family protein [Streptomyces catenulae]
MSLRDLLELRIEGHTLPGRRCAPGPGFPGADGVEVAVQRRDRPAELLGAWPGDAPSAVWTVPCSVTADGALRGPYVQNRLGGRFVYLSWTGRPPDTEEPCVFRRAKLMLDGVPAEVFAAARQRGVLVGRLALSDGEGLPLCGRVVPPAIGWRADGPPEA